VIKLIPGSKPKSIKVYSLFSVEQKELDTFLQENLHTGQICPFKSPMATLVFFIKEKNSSLWLIQDYWALSSIMVKNKYSLSLISELVSQLHRAKYFTKLNVHWGFNNVYIKPRDKWKTTFHTNYSLFKPLVMFFKMTNSLATFQMIMNNIFRDLITKGIVVVYLDNILIFIRTVKQYTKTTQRVLEILVEHKLCLCLEKCEFQKEHIKYLGLVVSENKISIDSIKVAGV